MCAQATNVAHGEVWGNNAMVAMLGAFFGAAVGSFLNVVIYRVPSGLSVVSPPSACPHCGAAVRWYHNVPVVSWLVLRARCRDCAASISARYPLIELATALAFAGIAAVFAPSLLASSSPTEFGAVFGVLVALLYFAAVSIVLTAIDIDTHRLPNLIVVPAYPVVAIALTVAAVASGDLASLARAAAGAALLFALYFALALISPRGMGMGDVKLAGVVGLMLGWFGWAPLAVGALAGFLLGGVFGIILIVLRRASRSSGIPFGPWMLAGAWLGIVFGDPIARAYLAAVGLG
jgi:leader peptidase (prepilin peptidase)/N-methyltransferase